jgi:hypothetical protein
MKIDRRTVFYIKVCDFDRFIERRISELATWSIAPTNESENFWVKRGKCLKKYERSKKGHHFYRQGNRLLNSKCTKKSSLQQREKNYISSGEEGYNFWSSLWGWCEMLDWMGSFPVWLYVLMIVMLSVVCM